MKIELKNIDFKKDVILPENISEINNHIFSICSKLPALNILSNKNLLNYNIDFVKKFMNGKKHFVVFGTGGSNLGARALININNKRNNISFFDNIDPIFFEKSFNNIDFNSTGFIVISKSGTTPETLSQFGSIIEVASNNDKLKTLFSNTLVITEFSTSPLLNIAKKNKCLLLEHDKNIGGRYSVFTNVGLVPAIIAGLDVEEIYKGAFETFKDHQNSDFLKIGQVFKYQSKLNLNNNVIMTYSDSLYYFGKWYLQLWAESIGKNNKGITAIHSIGTTDQHSQLQLYLEGPRDKFFTFVTTDHKNKGLTINNDIFKDQNFKYFKGKKMGDLMQAEQMATLETFNINNFKFREINLNLINEKNIGSLMTGCIIETIASCVYFEVDPFNQPAVEQGKKLTKKYLS
tara:strand:+ start:292 stop:1500 length:1209 start_codon:yes stop_codon:yes gene_type:complete